MSEEILREIAVLDKGFVRLVEWVGSDAAIVRSARVSYGEGTKTVREDTKLIEYLVKNKHTSPLEAVRFTFHVKAPLFIFRQWHRHRTWSYNEISARYSEMKDEFYIPELTRFTTQDTKNRQGSSEEEIPYPAAAQAIVQAASEQAFMHYQALLASGVSRELARIVLPVNLYSEMYASVDLNNLMKFLALRLDKHAQKEIQEYSRALETLATQICPTAFKAWETLTNN